ncbi:MAG: hypothetical protein PF692_04880 [Kiritimatiellae bacterium]|jgi:hypothetical protein|nr:hypothetical protein [Kiritimatiellia bacterium]
MTVYIGTNEFNSEPKKIDGEYLDINGKPFYCISNYDAMDPFFMTIVSSSDHWMYISSTGGLTAGRINSGSALFPYYTDDKVQENFENTGSKTILIVNDGEKEYLWEPFSSRYSGVYDTTRNIYKNIPGSQLIFEEINNTLGVTFSYQWSFSDTYGIVKTSKLENNLFGKKDVKILDGIQNIIPYGIYALIQNDVSCLLDAYKRSELDKDSGLAVFSLTSILTDLAEASEALKTTTVWQVGLSNEKYILTTKQLDTFRRGECIVQDTDICGGRGAFMVNAEVSLEENELKEWHIVAEVNQNHSAVNKLIAVLKNNRTSLPELLLADVAEGTENLNRIVGRADGIQLTEDRLGSAHHYANVMFNTMRGGVFDNGYAISKTDFIDYVSNINKNIWKEFVGELCKMPEDISQQQLLEFANEQRVADLKRICYEYLPLSFSRRHGDPSRPWNQFSINLKKEDGSKNLDYQGNWRDIFQNWEALAYSFPEFIEGMMCRFLNSTTADGYNPYRITRNGLDWEKPDPGNPWANIGYWGDHQIIYLQKLIETSLKFHPKTIPAMLEDSIFSYANVPYRIKNYNSILANRFETIDFDWDKDSTVDKLVEEIGADGRLVMNAEKEVLHVNLTEKLLLLLLTKMSNFIPEGGIWLNTQRPEWNDANNALVGSGVSMVTLYYLRRYVASCQKIFNISLSNYFSISTELEDFFVNIAKVLNSNISILDRSFDKCERRTMVDALGQAGSDYRTNFYNNGLSGRTNNVDKASVLAFLDDTLSFIEHTIRANRREDGLFHSYNLLTIGDDSIEVSNLYEMLEGQVAVLSSGYLSPEEALITLDALRNSAMYRKDQNSYMLYPRRALDGFFKKNCVSDKCFKASELMQKLVDDKDISLVERDCNGLVHFNGSFKNAKCVIAALNKLAKSNYKELVEKDSASVFDAFEKTFNHHAFTGRSGSFFAYEGLGSIYWHMVSKLLLTTQEICIAAKFANADAELIEKLENQYYEIRQGIGFNKTPQVYGAFPTDPYSHSPWGKGAKQPGMTGQVKEEVLTRAIELGVMIQDGSMKFNPELIKDGEFLSAPAKFNYFDIDGNKQSVQLPKKSLAMTFCQVPIVFKKTGAEGLNINYSSGTKEKEDSLELSCELSGHIFERDGEIDSIEVTF